MHLIRLSEDYITEIISGKIGARRPQLENSVLTLGSFDGLHLGHQQPISRVRPARTEKQPTRRPVFPFLQPPRLTPTPPPDCGGPLFLITRLA